MTVKLSDIQSINALKDAKLIAGKNGRNKLVDNIMVLEAPDVNKWIKKNEVLISSLYGFNHLSKEAIQEFMQSLSDNACSGLIIKISRFVDEIPQTIIDGCNKFSIPLLQIPKDTSYNSILLEVMQLLFNESNRLLDRYKKINQQFIQLAIHDSSLSKITNLLSQLVQNPTCVFQLENEQIAKITPANSKLEWLTGTDCSNRQPISKHDYTNYQYYQVNINRTDKPLIMVKIPQSQQNLYLAIVQQNSELQDIDFMAIENAVNFIQMEILKQEAINQGLRTYANDMIDDLLNGKIAPEVFKNTLANFELDSDEEYRIAVVQSLSNDSIEENYFRDNPNNADRVVGLFKRYWPKAVYRIRQNRIILIISEASFSNAECRTNLQKITDQLKETNSHHEYQIGLSEQCEPSDFKHYASQALKTLQIANQLHLSGPVFSYNDLGFYRFLLQVKDPKELTSFVPESLLELHQNDSELFLTLKAYLENNQNMKVSANTLFIHPKTMSYRLNKVHKMVNIDFSDVNQIFELNVGLRILSILDANQ
ncbi:PucR family transcriptional regulator [Secundilactobacillus mixtipabuli]|uniref:Purine transport regulator n=1 Tax=Secundilactobacillus mixtipabuli TaxID=1435342 RepID=A0A1Z5IA57_9LACO|nr:PucR family transcriptional regulator [Secundilactobacillus mixtipabuli]GAW98517.1 purine transport regulator [Secundilactobacillus mixtipabuli]